MIFNKGVEAARLPMLQFCSEQESANNENESEHSRAIPKGHSAFSRAAKKDTGQEQLLHPTRYYSVVQPTSSKGTGNNKRCSFGASGLSA